MCVVVSSKSVTSHPDVNPLIGTFVNPGILVPDEQELSVHADKLTFTIPSPPVNDTIVEKLI
jgi:hypothetical protein